MGPGPRACSSQAGVSQGEVEVLELMLGEDLVAWAARHKEPKEVPGGAAPWPAVATAPAAAATEPLQSVAAAAGGSSGPSMAQAAQRQRQPGQSGEPAGEGRNGNAGPDTSRVSPHEAHRQEADEEEVTVVSFYRGGRLLGQLLGEQSAAASNAPSAARFLNADGVHTHTGGWAHRYCH